jgi:Transposase zinc-binding domain/Putative transposase
MRTAGESFFECSQRWFTWLHLKVWNAILRCRTAALGGHADACSQCGHEAISYNSCRDRHCPKCQANARDRWLEARGKELLPTRHVHVVFTLPRHLSPLALQNKREIYALLFWASAETLLQVARDPKHLGAEIGFFSVLHTWNQQLLHHPHIHSVVPAGGLAPDHSRWIDSQQKFFLPVDVLKEVFRGKFVDGLKTMHAEHKLAFHGTLASLQNPKAFAAWLRPLFRSQMGGLRKTSVWWCPTRASLPRPVHPSGSDFQPSASLSCRWHGHFSLARFRSQEQEAPDDAAGQRVSAPIPTACAAAGIRPHPPLRVDGPPPAPRIAAALLTTACPSRTRSGRSGV